MIASGHSWIQQAPSKGAGRIVAVVLASLVAGAVLLDMTAAPADSDELPAVKFGVPGGIYTNTVRATLSAEPASVSIHYTLDGSDPTVQSPVYSRPIEITNSVLVKARTFRADKAGLAASQTYTFLDDRLTGFDSNLPLVVIDTFGHELGQQAKTHAAVRFIRTENGRASLTSAAELDCEALANIRGHTSLRYPKRSYHLKTRDPENQPLKSAPFGLPRESDWVLYAPYSDKTLMRDVLAYELSNQMGRYAPRTRFVELFLNPTGGRLLPRHYMGVYVLEEKIKRGKNRVPIAKIGPDDNAEPAITGGYILKKDHTDHVELGSSSMAGTPNTGGPPPSSDRDGFPTGPGGFPGDPRGFLPTRGRRDPNSFSGNDHPMRNRLGFVSSHGTQLLFVEPKASEVTPVQRRWLIQYVRKAEAALYGSDFRDPEKGYAAYLDAGSFIDHHLLVEITKNIDGFRFSTFLHKDRGGRLAMGPIWDWNLSFGEANGKQGFMSDYWYWPQLDDQQVYLVSRLFEDPDFAQKYVDRWGQLRTNQFATAKLLARVDELSAQLNEAQARNFKRWRIIGRQVWPNNYTGKSYEDEVQYLKNWTTQRLHWIDRQFVLGPTLVSQPAKPNDPGKLVLRSTVGKTYDTLDGSDPRAPGGAISPRAQIYKGPLALKPDAVVMARVLDGKRWSWPVATGK